MLGRWDPRKVHSIASKNTCKWRRDRLWTTVWIGMIICTSSKSKEPPESQDSLGLLVWWQMCLGRIPGSPENTSPWALSRPSWSFHVVLSSECQRTPFFDVAHLSSNAWGTSRWSWWAHLSVSFSTLISVLFLRWYSSILPYLGFDWCNFERLSLSQKGCQPSYSISWPLSRVVPDLEDVSPLHFMCVWLWDQVKSNLKMAANRHFKWQWQADCCLNANLHSEQLPGPGLVCQIES